MNYKNLSTRKFSFYENYTHDAIQRGDIGIKIYPLLEGIEVIGTLRAVPITNDLKSADFIVNTALTASPSYKHYKTADSSTLTELTAEGTVNTIVSEKFIVTTTVEATPLKVKCIFNNAHISVLSDVIAQGSKYITGEANALTEAYMEAESLYINGKEKRHNTDCFIIKNYEASAELHKNQNPAELTLQEDYEATLILPNYEKEFKPYSSLENMSYEGLSSSNYANLSYGKQILLERSVVLNG